MLSFEALTMEVMGLIQRWRDQAGEERREEKRGLRLNLFYLKKKKMVAWQVRTG